MGDDMEETAVGMEKAVRERAPARLVYPIHRVLLMA